MTKTEEMLEVVTRVKEQEARPTSASCVASPRRSRFLAMCFMVEKLSGAFWLRMRHSSSRNIMYTSRKTDLRQRPDANNGPRRALLDPVP